MFQAITLIMQVPLFAMVLGVIAYSKTFQDIIGEKGCHASVWIVRSSFYWGIVCGFIMALYRLTCMKGKRYQVNYLIGVAFGLQIFLITNTVSNLESNAAYQFCMGREIPKSVPTNTPYITDKILRARVVIMLLGLVSSEFLIYLYILHDQQRHNDKHLQQKIINKVTFKNRKEKNIITLKGQICIFATKMATIILILITKILNLQLFNVNSYPFLTILSPTGRWRGS